MTRAKFTEIWDKIIKPKVEEVQNSPHVNLNYRISLLKEKIFERYHQLNPIIHTYLPDPSGRIDRHKIASAFIQVIMELKPFSIDIGDEERLAVKYRLVNEILAFYVGISIVYSFIMEDADSNRKIFEKGFLFPKCPHGDYLMYIYENLYYAFSINENFDLFTFANLLFLIEEYTIEKNKHL